jgi:hypothetical protein
VIAVNNVWPPNLDCPWEVTGKIFQFLSDINHSDMGILLIDEGFQLFRLNEHFGMGISTIGYGMGCSARDH